MIRKLLLLLLLTACGMSSYSVQYQKSDSLTVMKLFSQAKKEKFSTMAECTMFFATRLKGVPYVAKTLEGNRREQLVVNLRQLDCTTFVENAVALSMAYMSGNADFSTFCKCLEKLRYKGGHCGSYADRLHYFTAWIDDNTRLGICREIQTPVPPFSGVQHVRVDYMTRHADKYPMLYGNEANMKGIAEMEKSVSGKTCRYIPKAQLKNPERLRTVVKNGDIIAIITSINGLDTQHIGFALWHKDGLHLLNASSIHRKVVDEPMLLYTYLLKHKTMPGVRIVRLA